MWLVGMWIKFCVVGWHVDKILCGWLVCGYNFVWLVGMWIKFGVVGIFGMLIKFGAVLLHIIPYYRKLSRFNSK